MTGRISGSILLCFKTFISFLYLVFNRILTHNHHQLGKICIRNSIVLLKIFRTFVSLKMGR